MSDRQLEKMEPVDPPDYHAPEETAAQEAERIIAFYRRELAEKNAVIAEQNAEIEGLKKQNPAPICDAG